MTIFSVLNGTGFNGAGIQFQTLADQVTHTGLRFSPPPFSPTMGTITYADGGALDITGIGLEAVPITGGWIPRGTMTGMTYSMLLGVISPVLTPIFSITGFSEAFADIITFDFGGPLEFLADAFSESDAITGSSVNDRLMGFAGADIMNGGLGIDTLSYQGSFAGGVNVSLVDGSIGIGGDAQGDQITGFENLVGSEGNDVLDGNAGGNLLVGRGGADFMLGHLGNDT